MIRSILVLAVMATMSACGTVPERKDTLIGLKAETPLMVRGERLTSPELAATLAELVLVSQGHDCIGFRSSISFCEGVYKITFTPGQDSEAGKRYEVELDAANSEVLRVTLALANPEKSAR
jgi:hypothetical protein